MVENALVVPTRSPVGWYEAHVPIRGCALDLEQIRQLYNGLTKINREFGDRVLATLQRDSGIDDVQWEQRKRYLLDDAFRITVTIEGQQNEQLYGEDASVFQIENLPLPISTIYFTNATAWRRNAQNTPPPNEFELLLDFRKPALLDPNPLVSEATPNASSIKINAREMTYFRAVRQLVEEKLMGQRTLYSLIHKSHAYDVGLWIFVLPVALLVSTHYMDRLLPTNGSNASYRWAFFVYGVGLFLVVYRVLVSYTKWAFPVIVLRENRDPSWRHRAIIGAVMVSLCYQVVDILWSMLSPI